MKNNIGKKVLVTTTNWFMAPDGLEYKAVFGTLHSIEESEKTLGFKPNPSHTNWFLRVGNVNIAGCQVMYMVQTDEVNIGEVKDFTQDRTKQEWQGKECITTAEVFIRPSKIYAAED